MRAGGGDDLPSAKYLQCVVRRCYSRELYCTPMEFINSENAGKFGRHGPRWSFSALQGGLSPLWARA
jgi:hypothetical protein